MYDKVYIHIDITIFFQNIGQVFKRINSLYINIIFFLMYNMNSEELNQWNFLSLFCKVI
jgi:hypothetical protein